LKFIAKVGDILKHIKVSFPMTSFRLKNMSTNIIIALNQTLSIAGKQNHSLEEGIRKVLN